MLIGAQFAEINMVKLIDNPICATTDASVYLNQNTAEFIS